MSLKIAEFRIISILFFLSLQYRIKKSLSKWNTFCLLFRLILRSSHDTSLFLYLTNYPSLYLIHSLPFINLVSLSSTLLTLHLNTKVCRSKTVSPLLLLSTSAPCPGSLCSDEVLLPLGAFPHWLQEKLGISPSQVLKWHTDLQQQYTGHSKI
jgi:hypothetical protein